MWEDASGRSGQLGRGTSTEWAQLGVLRADPENACYKVYSTGNWGHKGCIASCGAGPPWRKGCGSETTGNDSFAEFCSLERFGAANAHLSERLVDECIGLRFNPRCKTDYTFCDGMFSNEEEVQRIEWLSTSLGGRDAPSDAPRL